MIKRLDLSVLSGTVTHLASQTAPATEEITRQVEDIQGPPGQAVPAIRAIGGAISGIDEKMTAIAAAVEQQRAATTEISRNFQQAAQGTREVTDTIGSVARLNQETGNAGTVLSESVKKMSADADRLRVAIDLDQRRARDQRSVAGRPHVQRGAERHDHVRLGEQPLRRRRREPA